MKEQLAGTFFAGCMVGMLSEIFHLTASTPLLSDGDKQKTILFKGLRPPAADPQKNEGMMLRGYEATRLSLWRPVPRSLVAQKASNGAEDALEKEHQQ